MLPTSTGLSAYQMASFCRPIRKYVLRRYLGILHDLFQRCDNRRKGPTLTFSCEAGALVSIWPVSPIWLAKRLA